MKKILVVDDDPNIVRVLKSRLKDNCYDVLRAYDGENCLKKAAADKPDLILLDIMLPGLDGFEVCRRLKADERTKRIPVIMLTALSGEKDLEEGLKDGAECFITKPFTAADLLCEIEAAMRGTTGGS